MKHSQISLVFLAACGGDAALPDAAAFDSSVRMVDAPFGCDVEKPFTPVGPVPGINGINNDRGAWMTSDRLTVYYSTNGFGTVDQDLYVGTRANDATPFMTMPLAELNTSYSEERPVLSADGLEMFLEVQNTEIHRSTRASLTSPFSPHVAVINDDGANRQPFLTADGLTLYFTSNRTGNFELYRVTRAAPATPFGPVEAVTELNTQTDETAPVLSNDGLEMFFGRYLGFGNIGVYRATRATASGPFGSVAPVTELGVEGEIFPSWLSANRCALLYTRTPGAGQAGWDVWLATRSY